MLQLKCEPQQHVNFQINPDMMCDKPSVGHSNRFKITFK